VGYGDITAYDIQERIVTLAWMVAGVGFYAFVIGNLSSIIENMDVKAARLSNKMTQISEFVRVNNLPQEIEARIKRFVENNHVEQL
jgi:hypothetical protein